MATAILKFDLADTDDERAHKYALAGKDALVALEQIRGAIRSKLKYGDVSQETTYILEELRELIPHELVELLV